MFRKLLDFSTELEMFEQIHQFDTAVCHYDLLRGSRTGL